MDLTKNVLPETIYTFVNLSATMTGYGQFQMDVYRDGVDKIVGQASRSVPLKVERWETIPEGSTEYSQWFEVYLWPIVDAYLQWEGYSDTDADYMLEYCVVAMVLGCGTESEARAQSVRSQRLHEPWNPDETHEPCYA